MSVSRDARLLFIGIWSFCDDAGRFRWNATTLRAQVFPGDDLTDETVLEWMSALAGAGLVHAYSVSGKVYGRVTGWHHQKIKNPSSSKYPGPEESDDSTPGLPQASPRATPALPKDPLLSDPLGSTLSDRQSPDNDQSERRDPTAQVVRRFYSELVTTELGSFPSESPSNNRAHADLTTWANKFEDPYQALQAAFYGFREDKWARERGYPLAALAGAATKHHLAGLPLLAAALAAKAAQS